jgi:cysteine-rich repeat protein
MKRLGWVVVGIVSGLGAGCGDDGFVPTVCGDGIVEAGEQCDDGNTTPGDGCSATCAIEPRCGDGIVNGADECDDGNTTPGDGCSATCMIECGNGELDPNEQCDDGNLIPSDGCSATCTTEASYSFTATWQIKTFGGQVQACPQGFDTAAVISQPLDASGAAVGTQIVDLFDCSAGTGTIAPIYEGTYRVHIAITNTNGTLTYASTVATRLVLDASGKTIATQILTDGGYFGWAWALVGASSNNALTCAQIPNLDGVELVSTVTSTTMAYADLFDCEAGSGVTAGLPAGSYTVSADAFSTSGDALGTAPPLVSRQIMGPNRVTDLGTITIPIDGQ